MWEGTRSRTGAPEISTVTKEGLFTAWLIRGIVNFKLKASSLPLSNTDSILSVKLYINSEWMIEVL